METKTSDFTSTILVNETPETVFNAINNVSGWWSEEIEGVTNKQNGEFLYHYKDVHICKLKVVALVANTKVVWLVLDNHFSFTKDKKEWKGTTINFEIKKVGKQTELRFTHVGLSPAYECYTICEEAWTKYIQESLYGLITTGEGMPNAKEGGFNQELVEKHLTPSN
ncbi:SRPBCC family protein [Pseudochryseolinea flava]|uniref:SRPBCC domain-containing protein n=1 Tax=Pseudochryseolinea flava TaxID=2059302 RepID=A0A364Y648_9BACT|nr:SRPBCC domain-containing protein [Pseudochryseolinea flava]RAW02433.1 SRPBCC domain-containing protein [Pseudochryseolinea flava]